MDLSNCPLCHGTEKMGKKAKELYGVPVCQKCYFAFANRRQLAFLLDSIIWNIGIHIVVALPIASLLMANQVPDPQVTAILTVLSYGLWITFYFKDGFNGKSPGRAMTGLRVLGADSGQPISFLSSFKRNLPLLIPFVPLFVAFQLCKGKRVGDGWANSRVIWEKYQDAEPFKVRVL